jgi:hypothetical protein
MPKSHLAVVLSLVLGMLAACGGSTSAGGSEGNSVSGTVAGTTFNVASEVAVFGAASATSTACAVYSDGGLVNPGCVPTTSSSGQVVTVLLTNRADLTCAALQSEGSHHYANLDLLTLEAFTLTGTLATGAYDVATSSSAASGALAQFQTSTSTCNGGVNLQAASAGSITLTEVSSTSATGTYSVTFGTQGTFSGSFDVPLCDLPDAGTPSPDAGPPVCEQ